MTLTLIREARPWNSFVKKMVFVSLFLVFYRGHVKLFLFTGFDNEYIVKLLKEKYGRFALAYDILQIWNWKSDETGENKIRAYLERMINEAKTGNQMRNLIKVFDVMKIIQLVSHRVSKRQKLNKIISSYRGELLTLITNQKEYDALKKKQK